jgi:protein tyrosine/serine phosphatase
MQRYEFDRAPYLQSSLAIPSKDMNAFSRLSSTLMALALLACANNSAAARPPEWAQPLALSGVPNLHQVDDHLYRSAQPKAPGMRKLEQQLGVRTVINLRNFNSDQREIRGTQLALEEMDINTWDVRDEHVVRVLKILRDRARGPFLVHCQHGADRTGLMMAMYRMVEQGWSREDAVREMTQGGYGFHKTWRNILRYVRRVDVDKIRAALAAH